MYIVPYMYGYSYVVCNHTHVLKSWKLHVYVCTHVCTVIREIETMNKPFDAVSLVWSVQFSV